MSEKTSTGNRSTGNFSTGNRSTGDCSTGNCSTGNFSTGNRSTGDCSTGNWSTGDCSTGDCSTGNRSTGNRSTGNRSTGNWSTGNRSTGNWSTGDYSVGHFSTEDYSPFGCFDKPCSKEKWDNAEKPSFLYFNLTIWVTSSDMTDSEKSAHPLHEPLGGYLKVLDYKEAFKASWDSADKDDRVKVLSLPNFDAKKFLEISGIDVNSDSEKEEKKQALISKAKELLAQAELM